MRQFKKKKSFTIKIYKILVVQQLILHIYSMHLHDEIRGAC